MSAVRLSGETAVVKYVGEIQDYYFEWVDQIAAARVTAASATGAWSLAGETGSAFSTFSGTGMSASALSMTHVWTAFNSASGNGLTATGSASALISLVTTFRASGGVENTVSTWSAELRTSSGRYLQDRWTYVIGGWT